MNKHRIVGVRCTRITRQGYELEVRYIGEEPAHIEKSASDLTSLRAKIADEVKSNPALTVPDIDVKGVKWFTSKKDEKKKKAVDDFFQQILQLPVGGDTVQAFLQPSSSNKPVSVHEQRSSSFYEDSSVGQYEDINELHNQMKSTEPTDEPDGQQSNETALYAPINKMSPPMNDKSAANRGPSVFEIEPYAEVTATMERESNYSDNEESGPTVPPKIGFSPNVESTKNVEESLQPSVSQQTTEPVHEASGNSSTPLNSVPPMPTFSPPALMSPKELPDSIETVSDSNEVQIVAIGDYTSPSDNVLSFKRGSLASLVVQTDTNWWCVKLANSYGWVPADYWRKINSDDENSNLMTKTGAAWFVGKLSRNECEDLLMEHGKQQHFVVRESTNLVGHYAISVKYNDRVHHFPIKLTTDNKYYIGKHHFKTVKSVISYYKKNPLFYDDKQQEVTLGSPLVIVMQ